MINDGFFVISYPEMSEVTAGSIVLADKWTENYFLDNKSRATMCCNCDKTGPTPDPDPLPD